MEEQGQTRFFEQVVLVSEDGKKTVIERDYSTGELEYWSMMVINYNAGGQKGAAQVPFKIDVKAPEDGLNRVNLRELAFAKYDSSLKAAEEGAQQQIKDQLYKAHRREQSKIVLADAIPPTPSLQ